MLHSFVNLCDFASLAEIHLTLYDLFVSIRDDHGFGEYDSLAAMTVDPNSANISAATISSTYGSTPRSFDILYAEDLIAIGNQKTSTVAIVEMDIATGKPGKKLAEIQGVVETDPRVPAPDSPAWWDVPVAEVSAVATVREARAEYVENERTERFYY